MITDNWLIPKSSMTLMYMALHVDLAKTCPDTAFLSTPHNKVLSCVFSISFCQKVISLTNYWIISSLMPWAIVTTQFQ